MNRFQNDLHPKYCRVIGILDEMDDQELKNEYLEAVADTKIPVSRIETIMRQEGHPIAHMTIYRHRVGQCTCPK